MFHCDQCDKSYKWRDSLTRHKKLAHCQTPSSKRKYAAEEVNDQEFYSPLKRSNAVPENLNPSNRNEEEEEPLQRSDGVPVTTVCKRNHQVPTAISESFKFKHPFGMLVAGPTQSGKTLWTMKIFERASSTHLYPCIWYIVLIL